MVRIRYPPGLRFVPTDFELVDEYLSKMANNMPFSENVILNFDVYAVEPWKLPNKDFRYGVGSEAYYFTKRRWKKKGQTSKIDRTAGEGAWVSEYKKPVKNPRGEAVGDMRQLIFCRAKANEEVSTDWNMQEYTISTAEPQELVLCRIKMKAKAEKMNKEENHVEDAAEGVSPSSYLDLDELAEYERDNFPPGFKFVPNHLELVEEYLLKKAKNMIFFESFIREYDVYSTEPWNLPNEEFKYGVRSEAYYFTKRSRKKWSDIRIDRTVGNGTWVGNGKRIPIKNQLGREVKVVGHVTHLSFQRANEKAASNWVMDEYTSTDPECKEWVVCRIKMNSRGEKRKRKEDEAARKTDQNVDEKSDDSKVSEFHLTATEMVHSIQE